MTKGSRLLKNWRELNDLTLNAAAKQIGASAAGWCDWENGGIPKLKQAFAIERLTSGAVPVSAWDEEGGKRKVSDGKAA